jgi:hypothetical protein
VCLMKCVLWLGMLCVCGEVSCTVAWDAVCAVKCRVLNRRRRKNEIIPRTKIVR